ncbi:MAG: transcription antitermination factor NusB [Phycisphaerae bacterium]|nr:transcription antitermination factor NusB [Phycisphaerae bacterium]
MMGDTAPEKLSPRAVALRAIRDRDGNVMAHVDRLAGVSELRSADRGLAMELAAGVIKRRSTLTAILRPLLRRPKKRLPAIVSDIMQLGLYQILFLDRVPDHAAVNETVKLAHKTSQSRHVGLINGVLRSALRLYPDPIEGAPPLSAEIIPKGPNAFYASPRAIFPDPASDPAGYLAGAYSLPLELAERWIGEFKGLAPAAKIAMHANCRAPMTVRPNTLKTDTATLLRLFTGAEISADPHANGLSIVVHDRVEALAGEMFAEGLFQPQDATATAACLAAAPKPGMRVLDTCAAPGTKTTHLAELMKNSGEIVALDVPQKLELINTNCRRMGISIVDTVPASQLGSLDPESFDVVLADVPCSNTGVLARRPEARWRFDEKVLSGLVDDQRFLAIAAAAFVKPGGRLVYSTCSLEDEEGSRIAAYLSRKNDTFSVVSENLAIPAGASDPVQWRDGGYCAVFER